MQTLYWHDYETWGTTPSVDRPSQFAGVRTDEALNIIEDPLVIYCQPVDDVLPHPEACLVTGITPQHARKHGVAEPDFIATIHHALAKPGTCSVGYNTIRFDDEVTRFLLYRNLYDPYAREWENGNSRWDIIDMVRLCYALRPDGIEWPVVDGKPSFKLELLTAANGISHQAAHDAYSDVEATINMAKLIRQRQPKLYDYAFSLRSKHVAAQHMDLQAHKPILHVSSMFGADRGCTSLVVPIAAHAQNKNAIIVYDLAYSPKEMMSLSEEELHRRVFTKQDQLGDGVERIALKLVHLNKSPMLATINLLDEAAEHRLGLNKAQCLQHWQQLVDQLNSDGGALAARIRGVMSRNDFESSTDPERQLYDGFISRSDKALMQRARELLAKHQPVNLRFADERLNQLLERMQARFYPATLDQAARERWRHFVKQRLQHGADKILSAQQLGERIEQLLAEFAHDSEKTAILKALQVYLAELEQTYDLVAALP